MSSVRVLLRIALLSVGLVAIATSIVGCREATSFGGNQPIVQATDTVTPSATPTTAPTPTAALHVVTGTKKSGSGSSGGSSGQTNWLYVSIVLSTCDSKAHPYPSIYLKNTDPDGTKELFWQSTTNNPNVALMGDAIIDGGTFAWGDAVGGPGPSYGPVTLTIYTLQNPNFRSMAIGKVLGLLVRKVVVERSVCLSCQQLARLATA